MSADILRDLARVKAVFQLRAIETIIRGPASADRSPQGGDACGSIEDESAVPRQRRRPMTVLISTDNLKEELGMRPFPANPVDQHARLMAALCEDFASPEFLRSGKTPRADAVIAVARQTREKE